MFARCELEAGAAQAKQPEAERQRVRTICAALPVVYPDERFPSVYGETLAEVLASGPSIAVMDLLIACAALVDDATLLTRNRKHFQVVKGLRIMSY